MLSEQAGEAASQKICADLMELTGGDSHEIESVLAHVMATFMAGAVIENHTTQKDVRRHLEAFSKTVRMGVALFVETARKHEGGGRC